MITIGVQTKGLLPEKKPEEAFEMIAKAGFQKIDLNMDAFLTSADLYKGKMNSFFDYSLEQLLLYFQQYKESMDKKNLSFSQMHSVYPFLVPNQIQQNVYMQQNAIPKVIKIAEALDIPWVVLHPCKLRYDFGVEKEFEENLRYYQSLIPLLKETHVGICVENLYSNIGGRIIDGPCANPQEAIGYVDVLNEMAEEELFGICLDVGHLQLTKRDPYEYITTVGNRIKILHLHENDTVGDLHQLPFSFGREENRGLDWDRFAMALKEIGFDGTLSFETHPCVRSFPDKMQYTAFETIYSIGEYLKTKIEMDD